uniref:Uncharacterized protein n=1 Tax=Oryza rufipogon TaxID=4529 RepID=A0A0E0MW61_ORYRU
MAAAGASALRPHLALLPAGGGGGGGGGTRSYALQALSFVSPLLPHCGRRRRCVLRSKASSSPSPPPSPGKEAVAVPTAESCVNLGLELFSKGRVKDALEQFENALELNPNPVEAQAALYNKACCHAFREESNKAADCLRTALRDYNLKFGTILNDPDLAPFRASPEFKELQEEALRGGEDIGSGFRRDLKLIIQGGDGAPDLLETVGNAAINIGGIVVLVALYFWENKKEEQQITQISRNETLSRLPVRLSTNRIIELVQLRDITRPVILAGSKASITRAMQRAERYRTELLKRGVLLIPVIFGASQKAQSKPRGFGSSRSAASAPSVGDDFEKRTESIAAKSRLKAEERFKADIVSPEQWESWIRDQQESEGVTPGEDVYIILRLDGRVRRSGRGMPNWNDILQELPRLEELLSKLER